MAVFSIALLGEHPDSVSLFGMFYNLLFVTLGNLVSGSLFMAIGYWASSPKAMAASPDSAKKIQTIINGLFDLMLIVYGYVKKVALFVYEQIQNQIDRR
jgi:hypothetical protein